MAFTLKPNTLSAKIIPALYIMLVCYCYVTFPSGEMSWQAAVLALCLFNPLGLFFTGCMFAIVFSKEDEEAIAEEAARKAAEEKREAIHRKYEQLKQEMREARHRAIEQAIRDKTPGYQKHLKPGSRYLTKGY